MLKMYFFSKNNKCKIVEWIHSYVSYLSIRGYASFSELLYTHSNDAVSNFKLTIYFVKNYLERKKNPKYKKELTTFYFILSFCFKKHFFFNKLVNQNWSKNNFFYLTNLFLFYKTKYNIIYVRKVSASLENIH